MNRPKNSPDEIRDLLDAWLAGDLAPGGETEKALLDAAGDDASLRAELEAHRGLRAAVRELPSELTPARDLWGGIAARVGGGEASPPARRAGFWRRPIAVPPWLALAAMLAIALGTGLAVRSVRTEPPVKATAAAAPGLQVTLAAYAQTDRQLATVRAELWRSIEERQDKLPPETRALVFANLRTIERSIAEIETALAAAPADPQLARTYVAYREREIAVLRQANELAARL
jgi:hypothetical protein